MADIIERHLCAEVIKQVQESVKFSPSDATALTAVYERVRERLTLASSLLAVRDTATARDFLVGQDQLNEFCRQAQKAHHLRVRSGDRETLLSSAAFLELLGGFSRMNSHLGTLGYAFGATGRPRRSRAISHPQAVIPEIASENPGQPPAEPGRTKPR